MEGYLFIAPSYLLMLLFSALPILFSLYISFSDWDMISGLDNIKLTGIDNYIKMWSDVWFTQSLTNNIVFMLVVVPSTLVIALMMAVLINDYVIGKDFVRLSVFLPHITNIVAISLIWSMLYSKEGPFVYVLRLIGMENPPNILADRMWAMPSIMLMTIWMNIGYSALIYIGGLQGIPQELYEAGDVDGVNWWQRLRKITIPMLSPTTFFLLITQVINSFKVFGPIQIMTQGGPVRATTVLVYYIYTAAFQFYKFGYASAIAMVIFVIILVITAIQWRGQKRWVSY
ncbi:MAG: sugar ABC transporter permease [Ruminococcaceae bacterium]|nr:sugar ABC transporter permease [Oscillospiraceae bacterium]